MQNTSALRLAVGGSESAGAFDFRPERLYLEPLWLCALPMPDPAKTELGAMSMSLSTAEIEPVVRELKPVLEGARLERLDQPERHRLVLTVRNGPALSWLLICAHPRFSRMHLLPTRPEKGPPAAGFCKVVRQHMTGAVVQGVSQTPNDRVVTIELLVRGRMMQPCPLRLVAELTGVGSNIVLLDEANTILAVLFRQTSPRRKLVAGLPYEPLKPPDAPSEKARANRFAGIQAGGDPLAVNRAIHTHYVALEASEGLESLRLDFLVALRATLRQRRVRLGKVTEDLRRAEEAESIRRKGELLKIALPMLKPRQDKVVVQDLFDPATPEVTIELNPTLTPEQNLERLFHQYRKAKAGRDRLAARAGETAREIATLERLQAAVEGASSAQELDELKPRLQKAGVSVAEERARRRPAREAPKGPRTFRSAEGLEILVARNQRENDRLTFTIARGNDYWMHLLGWPGPHVIIRKPPDKSVSQETLLDAAHLCVYFSKIRGTDFAEVGYTQCKHVRRMKGAPAGKVSYSNATTLQVRIEPERIERLMRGARRADEGDA